MPTGLKGFSLGRNLVLRSSIILISNCAANRSTCLLVYVEFPAHVYAVVVVVLVANEADLLEANLVLGLSLHSAGHCRATVHGLQEHVVVEGAQLVQGD